MALKLNISKAYDRIEWSFLEQIMRRMGFAEQWIRLIMMCVPTVTYSFKLNGIRQGDPLSPFLFVLCAEGLSSLFDEWERQGSLKGVKFANWRLASITYYLRTIVLFLLEAPSKNV